MKLIRCVVAVVAVAAMVVCAAGISYAMEKGHKNLQEKYQAKIKALKDSAALLQQSNPDLANGLNELAGEKEKMMQEMNDMKAKHEAKAKLLRDSAAALQKTNPDLAKELWDMSEYKGMKKGWAGKKMERHEECE